MSKIGDFFTKAAINYLARSLGPGDPRLTNFFAGGPTDAGENVSVGRALQLDTVWACVRLIAQTIATLPLFLYEKDANGRGILSPTDPLYRILHDQPNADMTASDFWQAMVASLLLWGNAYASIERIGGRVVALVPLLPERLSVRSNGNGGLTYYYSWNASREEFDESEIFHIKGFSLDGMVGLSPIAQARQALGIALAAERSAASFFRNGMQPSAYMAIPKFLTDPQRKDAQTMINTYSGALSAGRVPLLEGGFELKNLTMPPDDAQLLQSRGFSVEQVCRWFSVPPIMIGHMEKTTAWGTGMEQMMIWFLTFTLRPHLEGIEQSISKSLIAPVDRSRKYAEFNAEGLLRADSKARAALYQVLVSYAQRTPNELRALDNEPPLPGGDELMIPANLIPLSLAGKVAKIPTEKPVDPAFTPPGPVVPANEENQDEPK